MLDFRRYCGFKINVALLMALLIAASMTAGCGGKDSVKRTEDYLLADRAIGKIAEIESAYEEKDVASLQSMLEDGFLNLIRGQLSFSRADVSFSTPRLIRIEGDEVKVVLNWKSAWEVNGRDIQNRGLATLVFRKDTLKLIRTEGDNPFRLPAVNF
jgi:hypothetical protein